MKTAIIAKFLLETEDLVTLRDCGLKNEQTTIPIGRIKVPCYKFFNVNEAELFDILDKASLKNITLNEAGETVNRNFANRAWSIIFSQIREANKIKEPNVKLQVICTLTSTSVSMASVDMNLASRMLQLIRNL